MFSSERPSDVGTVGLLAATGLMVLGLPAVWIPLGPALEDTYRVPAAATALAGSIFAAGFAVGEPGPLADRYGLRPVLLIGAGGACRCRRWGGSKPRLVGARRRRHLSAVRPVVHAGHRRQRRGRAVSPTRLLGTLRPARGRSGRGFPSVSPPANPSTSSNLRTTGTPMSDLVT